MRKVVDQNYLKRQEIKLEEYLASSPENKVVFGEYSLIELFNGNAANNLSVLSKFPNQSIILKKNHQISTIYGSNDEIAELLIDQVSTKAFINFLPEINSPIRKTALIDDQKFAHKKIHGYDVSDIKLAIQMSKDTFTRIELKEYKTHGPTSDKVLQKLLEITLIRTESGITGFPVKLPCPPSVHILRNLYIFRLNLVVYILTLKWVEAGGIDNVSPEKLRRDLFDIQYVIYATYFDGFLSTDIKANALFQELTSVLDLLKSKFQSPDPEGVERE